MVSTSGPEVHLRDVRDDDLAVFFDHQRDERATAMAGVAAKEREPSDAHWSRILADASVITRTITLGDRPVGNVVSWLEQVGFQLVSQTRSADDGVVELRYELR